MQRIISVTEVKFGGDGKRKNKRYGWLVEYYGRVMQMKQERITRTTNLKTGAPLKKPVIVTVDKEVPASGIISKIVRRRKSLKRLGVVL